MESVLPNLSATTDAFKIESVIPNSSASTDAVTGKKYNVGIIIIYSLFFLACLWIILINGLLIICFWFNRREAWCSHSKNILGILIIDILDGLSTMTWFFVSFRTDIDRSVCLTSTAFSMASHSAASLNILRVCVTRLRSVRSTPVTHEQSTSNVIIQTIFVWLVASALVLVPLGFWTVKQPVLEGCRWTKMFSSNESYVNTYMLFMIALPTVGTTVLYGMLVRKLRTLNNLVKPTVESIAKYGARKGIRLKVVNKTLFQATTKSARNLEERKPETRSEHLKVEDTTQITNGNSTNKSSSKSYSGTNKKLSDPMIHDHMTLNDTVQTGNDVNDAVPIADDTTGDKRRVIHTASATLPGSLIAGSATIPGTMTVGSATMPGTSKDNLRNGEASISRTIRNTNPTVTTHRNRRVNKVIKVLGISLALINISNLPFTVFLFWKVVNPEMKVSAMLAALSLFFLMLNSACNAFVYVVELKPLRLAVLKTLREALSALSKVARCQTRVNPA